ncbi:unnamed protein product [Effrenium voratum]|nr:unnamed protein product [Effrenium voratum]
MSVTAPTHDGFETCFHCTNRARFKWTCSQCPRGAEEASWWLCAQCRARSCPACEGPCRDEDCQTVSSMPTSEPFTFASNISDLMDQVLAVLQAEPDGLQRMAIAGECRSNEMDVGYALQRLMGRGEVEEPQIGLWRRAGLQPSRAHGDVEAQILRVLRDAQGPLTALQIGKACGFQGKKDVNPSLYKLQKQGILRFEQQRPNDKPLWWLAGGT